MVEPLFKPLVIADEDGVRKLRREKPGTLFVDAFDRQLRELFLVDKPQFIGEDKPQIYHSAYPFALQPYRVL